MLKNSIVTKFCHLALGGFSNYASSWSFGRDNNTHAFIYRFNGHYYLVPCRLGSSWVLLDEWKSIHISTSLVLIMTKVCLACWEREPNHLVCCSYNMVGHTKFCLTLLGGFIFFHDPLQALQLFGLFLTFSGEYWYSFFPNYYPAPDRGTGYCFRSISLFVSLFVCFFVSRITRKQLDRFSWNFQGRGGVTMGRPDSILGQFR